MGNTDLRKEEGEKGSLLGSVGDNSCVCYTPRGNPKCWGPKRLLGTGLYLESRSEVALPGTRTQVVTPSLLSKQGGLPQQTLHKCAGIRLGSLQGEPELCGMGRHRHYSMTFLGHAVSCNKWKCPG